MASKITLNQKIEALELQVAEANQRAQRLARDNDAYRSRERTEMRVKHNEEQRRLKEKERAERLKRLENIDAGLLPLEGATSWAVVHEEGAKPGIEVFVPLSDVELQKVQERLNRKPEPEIRFHSPAGISMSDAVKRTLDQRYTVSIPQRFMTGAGIY